MRYIDVRRLSGAVESVMNSTSVVFRVDTVECRACRLCSPYVSRHTVEFREVNECLPYGVVYAFSGRHELYIKEGKGDFVPSIYPHSVDGEIRSFIYLEAPWFLVEPVISLARKLFGRLPFDRDNNELVPPLYTVHMAAPVLKEFDEDGKPIFIKGELYTLPGEKGESLHVQGLLLAKANNFGNEEIGLLSLLETRRISPVFL